MEPLFVKGESDVIQFEGTNIKQIFFLHLPFLSLL